MIRIIVVLVAVGVSAPSVTAYGAAPCAAMRTEPS